MPTVYIPAPMRDLTNGQDTVTASGSTVRQVVDDLDRQFPGLKDRLCDGNGLRPGIAVAVGTQVATLGLRQPVTEDSEVHFLPAISGGGRKSPPEIVDPRGFRPLTTCCQLAILLRMASRSTTPV
jgi:molybdopterin synthase sulfur carrier subunit